MTKFQHLGQNNYRFITALPLEVANDSKDTHCPEWIPWQRHAPFLSLNASVMLMLQAKFMQ